MCNEVTEYYAFCGHYGRTWCEPCENYDTCTYTGSTTSVLQDFCPKCFSINLNIAGAAVDPQYDSANISEDEFEL